MNSKKHNKHMVDILFTLALFCLFAVSSLMLVVLGANVYKKTVSNMEYNYNSRTKYAYITEKFRQNDQSGSVSLVNYGDSDAICFKTIIDAKEYATYLYLSDGYLKELFTKSDSFLSPNAGQEILTLKDMKIEEISNGLFQFTLTADNDETTTLFLSAHTN